MAAVSDVLADGGVIVHDMARAIRVGGQTVSPGEARVVPLTLSGRVNPADALPVWVAAGARPGPRVTVVGAPRGFEVGAARVSAGLRMVIDPAALNGGLVVVPVFRPGGRFTARGRPLRESLAWRFPGDPGGNRRAREAFGVFSELVVGSSVLILLTAADPGLMSALTINGDMDDPRVRRLARFISAPAAVDVKAEAGTLAAAAREMGAAVVEIRGPGDSEGDQAMMAAVLSLLVASGTAPLVGGDASTGVAVPPTVVTQTTLVRAPLGGLLEQVVAPGAVVERGSLLGRIVPPLLGRATDLLAPHDALVLQAISRSGTRANAPLFLLGKVPRAVVVRTQKKKRPPASPDGAGLRAGAGGGAGAAEGYPLQVGWVERVSLPSLGVERLRAKIDTGARTSALHVTRMTGVGTTHGPHRRPILELTLPAGSRRGAPPATVRVLVRDYVQVKDTSGRTERRPVIETTLRLGTLERRIRVTLTNRGDMLFPLLIGRTALGPGVVVDPSRRLLLLDGSPGRVRAVRADKPLTMLKNIVPES